MATTLTVIFLILIVILLVAVLMVLVAVRWIRNKFYEMTGRKEKPRTRNRREGEVTIVHTEQSEQKVSDDVGEYVDFKEIKDTNK